jgi:hypothetical protein
MLVIKEVLTEDSGIFTCRASNAAGVAECAAELLVLGTHYINQSVHKFLIEYFM